jgi:hypothetical protein
MYILLDRPGPDTHDDLHLIRKIYDMKVWVSARTRNNQHTVAEAS